MSSEPQNRPPPIAKKRPRGRPFTGPDDPRNRTNLESALQAEDVPAPVPVEGEGLLAAMRHVLVNDRAHDRTPEQKLARRLLKDQAKFFDRMVSLEKVELKAKVAWRSAGNEDDDLGEDLCLREIDRLLGEFYEQQVQEDAEFAARPDAPTIGASLQHRLKCSLERQKQLERLVEDLREKLTALGGDPDFRVN
jgi:hypothetical protein